MRTLIVTVALSAAAVFAAAWSDRTVDQSRPADRDVLVEINDIGGELRVLGWDREEVSVKGTLSRSIEELVIEGGRRRIQIEADTDIPHGGDSRLEIHVPAGASVQVDSFSAEITVEGVTGSVSAETVNGSISVSGSASEVSLETVNGGLKVVGPAQRVHAESVNGAIEIEGAHHEVNASTVNGSVRVAGGTFRHASLETVNGEIVFEGELDSTASLDAESVGGHVRLRLPANVSADFSLSSFSGEIEHDFDAPEARQVSRWTSEKELHFSLGAGGADVNVNTLSGSIYIEKKDGKK